MHNTLNEGGAVSDKEAKAAGFKSGADMTAFYANRERMRKRGGSKITTSKPPSAPAPKPRGGGMLGRVLGTAADAMRGDK